MRLELDDDTSIEKILEKGMPHLKAALRLDLIVKNLQRLVKSYKQHCTYDSCSSLVIDYSQSDHDINQDIEFNPMPHTNID